MLIDNATCNSTYSFMDGFSSYNQIKMENLRNRVHTSRKGRKSVLDVLTTLASMVKINFGQNLHIDIRKNPAYCCSVEGEINENTWYYDIKNFI